MVGLTVRRINKLIVDEALVRAADLKVVGPDDSLGGREEGREERRDGWREGEKWRGRERRESEGKTREKMDKKREGRGRKGERERRERKERIFANHSKVHHIQCM